MSVKTQRRDSKHRVLHTGESVRKRDGKYLFKYHVNGKPRFLESWRLTESDPQPVGRQPCIALRISDDRDVVESTKTNAGIRKLPLTEDVLQMFHAILEDRPGSDVRTFYTLVVLAKRACRFTVWKKDDKYVIIKIQSKAT